MNCLVWFSKGMFPCQPVAVVDAMDTTDNRNSIARFHSLDDACRHALHSLCLSTVHWACFAQTPLHVECNLVDSSCSCPSNLSREKQEIQPKHDLAKSLTGHSQISTVFESNRWFRFHCIVERNESTAWRSTKSTLPTGKQHMTCEWSTVMKMSSSCWTRPCNSSIRNSTR